MTSIATLSHHIRSKPLRPPYRVIQWATGKLGTESLRQIIDHPDLELVGVLVYSDSKYGQDAGSLCGRQPTGIRATNSIDAILATEADFVLHMPILEDSSDNSDKEVLALLASGKNVISIRGYFWPRWRGSDYEQQFIDACRIGNSSLHGTGISPGFVFDRMAPILSGFCTAVKAVNCIEYFDLRMRPWHTIHDVIGLAHPPGAITIEHPTPRRLTAFYSEMYHLMAAHWETQVESIDLDLQWVITSKDIQLPCGLVPQGTASATIWTWTTRMRNGLTLSHRSHWCIESIEGWDPRNVWIVEIDGEPRFRAEMELESIGPDALTKGGYDPNGRAIAALCINCIPEVAAAPPGIVKAAIFAPWRARFGVLNDNN